jgi:iron complex transport system substrate-binding protein
VGHSRQLSAEGILALAPDVVIATSEDIKPELAQQIRSTGVKLLLFDHHFSPNGTKELIRSMADSLDRKKKGDSILVALQFDLEKVEAIEKKEPKPKVLFIYARGTGTMMVAGKNTQVEKMIELAGGVNAVDDFTEFRPLTAEALVAANPDVILLFDSGLSSLGGVDGLLEVQGIRQTNAGKNKKLVEMEGQFLTGFSQRLGKAVEELAKRIH